MENVDCVTPYLEPIRKAVVVRRSPAEAFEIFTACLASWWPYHQFSIHHGDTATVGIEPRIGGEVYEVAGNGERARWGTVIAWEPPGRFAMTWHPGRDPDSAQVVELRFVPVVAGTRVELEHREWQKAGPDADERRKSYESGWATVFDRCYVEACV